MDVERNKNDEISNEELMLAYQNGDSRAFDRLYERTSPRVYGYLQRRIKHRETVDDIFQAIYSRFHQTRGKYIYPMPVLPWIFTICRNTMIDAIRIQNREAEKSACSGLATRLEDFPAENEPKKEANIGDRLPKNLSQDQKSAIELRFVNDLTFEDIAQRLQTSPANVRQMISRAIRKIRLSTKNKGEG